MMNFCKKLVFLLGVVIFTISAPISVRAQDIKDVYALVFILDGTPKELLYSMIEEGRLPTLKEYFWDGGTHSKDTITTFPSTSAPAYQCFITGLFAGRSGIPYLQWYDREMVEEIDYLGLGFRRISEDMHNYYAHQTFGDGDKLYPVTLFERLTSYPTAAIYSEIRRGAKEVHPTLPIGALSDTFITQREDRLDLRALWRVKWLFQREPEDIPRFILAGLYSADVIQHYDGVNSRDAQSALIQFDLFLKDFIALLKARDLFDKTYMVVAADHGMRSISKEADIVPTLRKAGVSIKKTTLRREKRDVFVSERGVSSAQIYITNPVYSRDDVTVESLRNYRPLAGGSVDLIDLIRNYEGTGVITVRDGKNRAAVFSKECSSSIETKVGDDGKFLYSYKVGDCDPLSYCDGPAKKLCGGKFYSGNEWLKVTATEKYPDGVVQLSQIFTDGRAGDIFISSAKDYGFYHSKMATHGSLFAEDMNVPLLIRGPDVPVKEIGPIHTVDIFPTLLKWFGLSNDGLNDGKELF